jgi:hypothetical protein
MRRHKRVVRSKKELRELVTSTVKAMPTRTFTTTDVTTAIRSQHVTTNSLILENRVISRLILSTGLATFQGRRKGWTTKGAPHTRPTITVTTHEQEGKE